MFEITDEHGWSDNLFPIEMTDELLVLRTESTVETDRKTIISKREEYLGEYTIWNGNMSLSYDPQKRFAELKEDDETIGRIIDLTYKEIPLYPITFFVDEENKIVLLCERGNEETEWTESYPVAVIASQDESEGGQYHIEKTQKFEHMFSDELSAVNAPYRSWFSRNTYADKGLKCFLWN